MRHVGDRMRLGAPIEWILTLAVSGALMIATYTVVSAATAPLAEHLAHNLAAIDAGVKVPDAAQYEGDAGRGSMPEALKAPLMST